jgi:prepilin-type processing-associated H-X9-DG protein
MVRTEDYACIVWFRDAAFAGGNPTIYQNIVTEANLAASRQTSPAWAQEDPSKILAQPYSNHPGGFNAVFADGNVRFLREDIQYKVYALLMTPQGKNAREPGNVDQQTNLTRNFNSPNNIWVADIVNEADLE